MAKKNPSRADRLGDAESAVNDAISIIEELAEEMENWRDNIPENLQGGSKYEEVEAAAEALTEIKDALEQAEFSVDFPGMFG